MIESKTLGAAVGIQRQDVIDNSESTSLPALTNGVIAGKFKRGRMDKPFVVTASNYQAVLGRDPSNASYLAVEDAFKRGVSQVSIMRTGSSATDLVIACTPTSILKLIGYGDSYVTVSREGGTPITLSPVNTDSVSAMEDYFHEFFMLLFLSKDGESLAFVDVGMMNEDALYPDGMEGETEGYRHVHSGISAAGEVFMKYGGFDPSDMFNSSLTTDVPFDLIDSITADMPAILKIVPEVNTIKIYPTDGAPHDKDIYYSFGGDDSGEPIAIYSCAKAVLDLGLPVDPIGPVTPVTPLPSSGVRIRTQNPNVSRFDVLYEYHPENIGNGGENNLNVGNLWADSAYDSQEKTAKIRINADGWSDWSDPIIFDDVNHPNSAGYLGVSFNTQKSPNTAMNMDGIEDSADFAWNLLVKLNPFGVFEYRNFGGDLSVASPVATRVVASKSIVSDQSKRYVFSYQVNDGAIVKVDFNPSGYNTGALIDFMVAHMPDKKIFKYSTHSGRVAEFWIDMRTNESSDDYVLEGLDANAVFQGEDKVATPFTNQTNTLKFLLTSNADPSLDMVNLIFGHDVEIRSLRKYAEYYIAA